MANEMGSQNLEPERDESEETSGYRILTFIDLPEDLTNVVIAPFLNSLRYGNDLFKLIDQQHYYNSYGKYITHLLGKPSTVIRMAFLNDGDTVLGWSISEGHALHYVWVKTEVRRQGICRSLLPKNYETFTHVTNRWLRMWSKFPEKRFEPFI